ncbi:hypothetical protein BRADO1984 [Bradyrhizobium sp. ORS 278]|nr:hypothetical protein BRADO1984 [Bradyrhizobium sp. ORS 278]
MLEVTMNGPATARSPGYGVFRWIIAGVLAWLGSLMIAPTAQAGYYGDGYYYRPSSCGYRCGYSYSPYRCSPCGCYRRCHTSRSGLIYERRYRYVEREYVERRYGSPVRHYGCSYCGYRRHGGDYPYRSYRSYPWGDGGVGRRWPTPYSFNDEPARSGYEPVADRYDPPPRPPAPVWDGGSGPVPFSEQVPYGAYGAVDVSRPLPRGPLGMIESGVLGFLGSFGSP